MRYFWLAATLVAMLAAPASAVELGLIVGSHSMPHVIDTYGTSRQCVAVGASVRQDIGRVTTIGLRAAYTRFYYQEQPGATLTGGGLAAQADVLARTQFAADRVRVFGGLGFGFDMLSETYKWYNEPETYLWDWLGGRAGLLVGTSISAASRVRFGAELGIPVVSAFRGIRNYSSQDATTYRSIGVLSPDISLTVSYTL